MMFVTAHPAISCYFQYQCSRVHLQMPILTSTDRYRFSSLPVRLNNNGKTGTILNRDNRWRKQRTGTKRKKRNQTHNP